MYSLACMRIRHITQVGSYLPTPPQTLSPNLNHLVIPKSVDPSRIEGRFSHHDARIEASRHSSSSNSKLQAHRALRRRDQAAREPRRQTRAAVSHMHARVVSPLASSPPFLALYSNHFALERFRTGWGPLGFPDCADQIAWE